MDAIITLMDESHTAEMLIPLFDLSSQPDGLPDGVEDGGKIYWRDPGTNIYLATTRRRVFHDK